MALQIETKLGVVEGVSKEGHTLFMGIPFARPPVGELRWKPPVAAEPWNGVYHADHFKPIAPQGIPSDPNPYYKEFYADPAYQREMSEDCLYLNIWAPDNAQGKKLPVAFYIHGGGFGGGYSSEQEFDGEAFCKKDVIFVTIAYRLGVLGFLAHPWLDAESPQHVSGNYGILDQIMALDWVYDNIAAFGGDPENITVFGQSAGCMSTQVLVSSELTKGKIAKAVLMSGVSCAEEFLAAPTLAEEEEFCQEMLAPLGAKDLQELREMDVQKLMDAKSEFDRIQMAKSEGAGGLMIVPNVDGYVLKKNVRDTWKNGAMHKIPYMVGCVTEDLGTTPEDSKNRVPGMLLTECERWAQKQEETGGEPAYVYWFDRTLPGDGKPTWHTLELWYVLGTLGRCWRPMDKDDYALSEEAVSCWTNFMKTGNPEGEGMEKWEAYTKSNPFVRHFE